MKYLIAITLLCSLVTACNQNSEKTTIAATDNSDIDALKASPENFKLLLENDHVRVLEYTLKPGAKDQTHTHPPKSSYVVSGGKLKVNLEKGESLIFDEKAGDASWMDHVGKHWVENIGTTEIKIILTEVKSSANKKDQ
jgi:quercetin dioxygenase-like cupin family protein